MSFAKLLESRLILVTGKGGTGKTTFAASIAALSAAKGRRTLLAEIDMQRPSMSAVFEGCPCTFEPATVRPNLDVNNIDYRGSLQVFVQRMVGSRRVAKLVLTNRLINRFLDFTPGSRDMVMLSALAGFYEQYDTVVVDMPASGHAFSFLDITRSARRLFRSGPVLRRADEVVNILHAPTTRMAFVGLPEEMVVNETIETFQKMTEYGILGDNPAVFLNRSTLPTMTDAERTLIQRLSDASGTTAHQAEFLAAGRWEDALEQATAKATRRLLKALPVPPILVPPMGGGGRPEQVVGDVAVHLGRQVGVSRRELSWG